MTSSPLQQLLDFGIPDLVLVSAPRLFALRKAVNEDLSRKDLLVIPYYLKQGPNLQPDLPQLLVVVYKDGTASIALDVEEPQP